MRLDRHHRNYRQSLIDALGELKPGRSPSHHISEDGAAVLKSSPSRCMRSNATSTARGASLRASAACSEKKSESPSSPTTTASPSITALRTFSPSRARAMLCMRYCANLPPNIGRRQHRRALACERLSGPIFARPFSGSHEHTKVGRVKSRNPQARRARPTHPRAGGPCPGVHNRELGENARDCRLLLGLGPPARSRSLQPGPRISRLVQSLPLIESMNLRRGSLLPSPRSGVAAPPGLPAEPAGPLSRLRDNSRASERMIKRR